MATRKLVCASLASTSALLGGARLQAQCTFVPSVVADYAPPEVAEAHPSHKLTVFLPNVPPPQDRELYPIVLYSPASVFSSSETVTLEDGFRHADPLFRIGDPPGGGGGAGGFRQARGLTPHPGPGTGGGGAPAAAPSISCDGFLAEALKSGWAVVTVGSTGWDSWPTCSQENDCNPCFNDPTEDPGCPATAGCWDTNLWYAPGTAEWDDFNLFWGEKDFLWARQWVGENAEDLGLDDTRIVACGTSTGAIYGAFLAFGPNRAWDASFSTQAQRDTRVAGLVAFEPNTWIRALRTSWPGVHWPSSDDPGLLCGATGGLCPVGSAASCYNRRAQLLGGGPGAVAPGMLEVSSISRWVRVLEDASERPTPTFVAAGDGLETTGFKRNANLPAYATDYDRHVTAGPCGAGTGGPTLIPGDPLLAFTDPDELKLHDSWFAMNFRVDLTLLDGDLGSSFHANRSSLFLQSGHVWGYLPPCLSETAMPPTSAAEVVGLDGTYANQGALVLSIENSDLAPKVIAWMEDELCVEREENLVCRNPVVVAGSFPNANFSVLRLDGAAIGVPSTAEIDLNGAPGYDSAGVLLFGAPAAPGAELVLGQGQVILGDVSTYQQSSFVLHDPDFDGVVRIDLGAPSPGTVMLSIQALLFDAENELPFALTNAVDLSF